MALFSVRLIGFLKLTTRDKLRLRWRPSRKAPTLILGVFSLAMSIQAQVVTYEGNGLPEEEGWERRLADTPGADRAIVDGWLVQSVDLPDGWMGPNGDAEFYRASLAGFAGVSALFIEWRAVTDNPSWLLDLSAVPAAVSAAGRGAALYHTTFTESAVQLLRDTSIPLVIVPVSEGVAHVYRVEVYGMTSYAWYLDGHLVESGIPESSYPDPNAFLIWGVRRSHVNAMTRWDYVRYGIIPKAASGDYDSDGLVTHDDFYFFHECLSNDRPGINGGPGNDAGPGCRFADFDFDADTDLLDFAEFQNAFGAPR